MARWVAQDTHGRRFEGYKEISLAEVLTLGDASTVAFTPDSKSDTDFLKKIDEIVTKLGLRSRAQFWLIRILLNYLHARFYESVNKKPMPLIVFGAKADKYIVGHIGACTTSLVASLGDALHPESYFRHGNKNCTPARIDELDNTLVQFMGPMLGLPAGSTTTFNGSYGNADGTIEERMLYAASRLEICSKGGDTTGKIATESADLVKTIMEDEGVSKDTAVDMLPSGKLKDKYLSMRKGGDTTGKIATESADLVKTIMEDEGVSKDTAVDMLPSGKLKDKYLSMCKKQSAEARAKISAGLEGRKQSAAHRAKLSEATKGRKHSVEARARMSVAKKGRKKSAAHRAKLSEATKGRKHSVEARAKMSVAKKGRKQSAAHRANISAGMQRRKQSGANESKTLSPLQSTLV